MSYLLNPPLICLRITWLYLHPHENIYFPPNMVEFIYVWMIQIVSVICVRWSKICHSIGPVTRAELGKTKMAELRTLNKPSGRNASLSWMLPVSNAELKDGIYT